MTSPHSSPPSLDNDGSGYLATPPYGPSPPLITRATEIDLAGGSSLETDYPSVRWDDESFGARGTPSPILSEDGDVAVANSSRFNVDEDYDGHEAPVEEIIVDGFTDEQVQEYKAGSGAS